MPLHFTEDFVLDGGDVNELPKPPPKLGLGQFLFQKLLQLPPDMPLMVESMSGRECSCREFLELSVNIALGLRDVGIGQGMTVCLVGRNSIDICAAQVATWLIGAIMTPIESSLKASQFEHLLKIVEPSVIICDNNNQILKEIDKALLQLPHKNVQFIAIQKNDGCCKKTLDDIVKRGKEKPLAKAPQEFLPAAVDCDDLALIITSSGTSEFSKAMGLTSYNMMYSAACISQDVPLHFLQTSPMQWISSSLMLVASISLGIKRVIVGIFDELHIIEAIEHHKPELLIISSFSLSCIVQHPDFLRYDTSSISLIVAGGCPLQNSTVNILKRVGSEKLTLLQCYGLTELSGGCVSPRPDLEMTTSDTGSPHPGSRIKVISLETGANLPPGEEGELCCKSPGMMKGYLKNPEATAKAIDEEGWLHTGDIGYISDKMTVFITGRIKELLNIGINVMMAPCKVEQAINAVPGVGNAAVTVVNISHHSRILLALMVKAKGSCISDEDIIKRAVEKLSSFCELRCEARLVAIIPRTGTGKIKRNLVQEIADMMYIGGSQEML